MSTTPHVHAHTRSLSTPVSVPEVQALAIISAVPHLSCITQVKWQICTFSQYIFTLHEMVFLCFRTKQQFNTTAVWKMLTNHELVVAWQLLEAVCPVQLTSGGISQKGLTAQWLQEFVSLYRGKSILQRLEACSSVLRTAMARCLSTCLYPRNVLDDCCVQLLIIMDGERNHSMGSLMDGTPPQSEDR